ncbi:Thioredoxin family protein [Prunus dulcis]|uniref:Thioredoxin family protein n=1 Tax=Prunus dulcis TaxID=3755 RepID=A0A4Y1RME0_PRUDU|nr:Thioredoxin family protein [Prunus dulcis]
MSTTLCYSSKPPHSFLTDFENSVFPRTSIPAFALKLSPYSQRLLRNGNWVSCRNRFHANSADSDADTNELETQLSRENGAVSSNGGNPSTSFLSVLCPLLKLFSGGDPSQERNFTLEVATSSLSTFTRFPWGSRSLSQNLDRQDITTLDPPMHLQLFEFEACPFCRRVREALTELDLSAEVYPCPKGSVRHREMVKRYGGKEQFPFLIDPNTGISMYESDNKCRTSMDYARIVREALCELELPYILQNVGEGSLRSKSLDASGSKEVPYLIDPNTGTQVGDYKKILSYLFQTYSAATLATNYVSGKGAIS